MASEGGHQDLLVPRVFRPGLWAEGALSLPPWFQPLVERPRFGQQAGAFLFAICKEKVKPKHKHHFKAPFERRFFFGNLKGHGVFFFVKHYF